jgi:puromycin-sensitive aminopeptidase
MQEELALDTYRLPRDVRPARYDLHLQLDPALPSFEGRLRIELEVQRPARELRLHAKGLVLAEATLRQGAKAFRATVEPRPDEEEVLLRFPEVVGVGAATLEVAYTGPVSQAMAGLYLSKDGPDLCLATQCEATDARAILPCFDEPDRKAVFAWTVTAPQGLVVLANGKVRDRHDAGGRTTWTFEPTPPMSSYLVATAVGAFGATEPVEARGVPMRVHALGGKERLGGYGRDLAARLLPWYEDYFGQPYAFGKYDQVAVPSFAFGAMENPGLVVFRPSLLLVDPEKASWDDRRDVALVVAHEFAHMWFGNLVTMAWWDDLWLNEAFAEWMAHKATDELDPGLDVWSKFRSRAAGALSTDTLASTHAIYHPVKTPKEAAEMFDAITYGKGSAVMRMLEAFLGHEPFRNGLRTYMQAHRFGNARGADLWGHLGKASGHDVAGIMQDWVAQRGHPLVTARWEAGRLLLRQERAVASPDAPVPDTLWRIPLVVRYADDAGVHEARHLVAGREGALDLPVQGRLRWLWPNAGDVGFVQCLLEGELQGMALAHARELAPAERIGLLRDLWLGVRAGRREAPAFLDALAQLLDGAAPYDVLQQQVGFLREMEKVLEMAGAQDALGALRAWVAARLGPAHAAIAGPRPGEDERERMRRAALLRAVGGIARHPAGVGQARSVAQAERADPAAVDATLSTTAVAVEAVNGDGATLERHVATYLARRDGQASPQDVERYLYALPAFRGPEQVQRVLALLASGTVAPQAVGPILRALLVEPHAQEAAWTYLQEHWAEVPGRLGESWVAILVEATGELPPRLADEVRAFHAERLGEMASQARMRAQERLKERAALLARITPAVKAWALGLAA